MSTLVQVFVLTTLQQLEPQEGEVGVVVLCHTRELAYQVGCCKKMSSVLIEHLCRSMTSLLVSPSTCLT